MLGGLEAYASDDSDSEAVKEQPKPTPSAAASQRKSSLSLPPPAGALPKPRTKRTIFTVAKPTKLSDDEDEEDSHRPVKKAKLESRTGAGSSSLLAMLPAPKSAAPAPKAAPARMLGSAAQAGATGLAIGPSTMETPQDDETAFVETTEKSTMLLPPSLAKGKGKGKGKASVPDTKRSSPAVDFFSLDSSKPTPPTHTTEPNPTSTASSSSISISSAPAVAEFEPPPPTPMDPYPGYYKLPSGQWAAYDPVYYRKFWEEWAAPANLDARTAKGFEGAEGKDTVEVDAKTQLDLARAEREEKKSLTQNIKSGPPAPKIKISASKTGSLARSRHQLHTLLSEAYENREALEERIAQGKRNRKEAGNKYGF